MMDKEKLNKARQKRVSRHGPEIRAVNPADILPYLGECLPKRAQEEITCEQRNQGQIAGAIKLFHEVVRYDRWFEFLMSALRQEGYDTIADLLDDPPKRRPNNHTTETERPSSLPRTVQTRQAEVTPGTRYRDLPSSVLEAIRHLDVPSPVFRNDWTGLAGKLGFTVADVQQLQQQQNPTQALLDEWSKEEGSTLGKLQEALHAINRTDVCKKLENLFNIPPLAADNLVDKNVPDCQPLTVDLKIAASSSKEENPRDSTSQSKAFEPCTKASVKKSEKDLPKNSEVQALSQVKGVESSGNSQMPDGEEQATIDGGTLSPDEAGWNVNKRETKYISSKLDGSQDAKGKANKCTADIGKADQSATRDGNLENEKSAGDSRAVQRGSNTAVNNLNRTSAGSEMNVTNMQKYDANCTGKTLLSNDRDAATTSCNLLVSDDYDADGIIGSLHSKESTIRLEISSRSCSTLSQESSSASLQPNPQIQNGNIATLQRSSKGAPVQQPTEKSSHMPSAVDVPSVDGTFTKDDLLIAGAHSTYHGSASNQVHKAVQEIQTTASANTQSDAAQETIQQCSPSAQANLALLDSLDQKNKIKGLAQSPAVNNQQQGDTCLGKTRGGLVKAGATADVGTVIDPVEPVGARKGTGTTAGIDVDVGVGATGGEDVGEDAGSFGDTAYGTCAGVGTVGNAGASKRALEDVNEGGVNGIAGAGSGLAGDKANDKCESAGTVDIVGAPEGASLFNDVCKGDKIGGSGSASAGAILNAGASEGDSAVGANTGSDRDRGDVGAVGNVGATEGASLPNSDGAAGPDADAAPQPQGRGALIGTVVLAVPVVMSLAALAMKRGALDI